MIQQKSFKNDEPPRRKERQLDFIQLHFRKVLKGHNGFQQTDLSSEKQHLSHYNPSCSRMDKVEQEKRGNLSDLADVVHPRLRVYPKAKAVKP